MARLLVRRPSPALQDGELTHQERVVVDAGLALNQWRDYVDLFSARGWTVTEMPAIDEHPDGVFVEDTVVIFDDLAVVTRPGAESRRDEITSTAGVVTELGIETVHITEPATLEGGDVLKVGRTVYVGLSTRTNRAAVDQLVAILEPRGWSVVAVPVTKALHLKTAVTALPDGTVVGYPPIVDDPSLFTDFLPVPEAEGTAVVVLDDASVLISAAAVETAALLRARGLQVVTAPITEFEKLEGCVTCLSIRVRG